ncbi:MAG: hypothetical protein M1837_003865 [Sclerophora amabilis]|nr:MAG: hypothetical protein M1837_003865 [Sclerophora amabilis]
MSTRSIGRGGAGNHISTAAQPPTSDDLEAQHLPYSSPPSIPESSPGEYVHTGRGGAGNWARPADVKPSTETSSKGNDNPAGSGKKVTSTSPPPTSRRAKAGMTGRGGAGNFQTKKADEDEDERERRDAESGREDVQEKVRRDVEAQLEVPGKAFLGRK